METFFAKQEGRPLPPLLTLPGAPPPAAPEPPADTRPVARAAGDGATAGGR